ncbi:MAG TPA: murein biosynthesis integral membrane protein MurJ [Candidatus Angelobacter sp.]
MSAADSSEPSTSPAKASVAHSAFLVAAGIFFSRISGLVRDSVFAHYFGISYAADAFRAAMRIPNFLQNLFGEGVLSASFIPVYARLVAEEKKQEAGRVAGAVFSLLALVTSILVLGGVLATPYLIDAIAPGFHGETRELAIRLVRIFFPGVGLLVLSAWCLGILNSHGRFFLSYVSPVVWNTAIITALLAFRRAELSQLAVYTAWASVAGSALQFLMQLPIVLNLAPAIRLTLGSASQDVRVVIKNFFPVFIGRGVTQLSAYIDNLLASFLPTGAVAALFNAQTLYMLPISLFGMSVSAAELPAMSSALGSEQQVAEALRSRISSSTRRIVFFVVPSAVAFLALGDIVAATIYQSGKFSVADAKYVWAILAGSAIGLVASTVGRLYSSAYYALRDTRTPLRFALVRVGLTTALGCLFALPAGAPLGPWLLGIDPRWGVAGLTASAGFSAWVEFLLLRRAMNLRIGHIQFPATYILKLWLAAILAAGAGWGLRLGLHPHNPRIAGLVILIPYGLVYLGLTALMGIDQSAAIVRRLRR